jgi:HK97 family phage prohead protease
LSNKKYIECPFEVKSDSITEDGIFEGYGRDYINKKDSYGDIISRGAFTDTIKNGGRNGNGIAMLWQHDSKNPIGVWAEIEEIKNKLRVVGQLALGVQQADEAYILMKMGAIKGLSIGWDFPRDESGDPLEDSYKIVNKDKIRTRYLQKIELWEISPVTFPANTRATITNVKGVIKEAKTLREFEQGLRESGLSKNASVYLASLYKPILEKKWNKPMYDVLDRVKNLRKQIGG